METFRTKNNDKIHRFLVADDTACIYANIFDSAGE
jgi:hypothetical protein